MRLEESLAVTAIEALEIIPSNCSKDEKMILGSSQVKVRKMYIKVIVTFYKVVLKSKLFCHLLLSLFSSSHA